jgi:hypothetical protein
MPSWKPGDRVLAHWPKEVSWWYPASVLETNGDKIHVRFDDGDQSWLSPDQVVTLEIAPGSRVFGRWKNGALYYPGTVTASKGDELHIRYDDGDEEWTHVRSIRVDRGPPPSSQTGRRVSGMRGPTKPATNIVLGVAGAAILLLLGCVFALVLLSDSGTTNDSLVGKWQRLGKGFQKETIEFTGDGKCIIRHGSEVWETNTYRRLDANTIEIVSAHNVTDVCTVAISGSNMTLTFPTGNVWQFQRKR